MVRGLGAERQILTHKGTGRKIAPLFTSCNFLTGQKIKFLWKSYFIVDLFYESSTYSQANVLGCTWKSHGNEQRSAHAQTEDMLLETRDGDPPLIPCNF